ncbi:MAG: endopygalactorunase, partial [Bacteroidota bacterium]
NAVTFYSGQMDTRHFGITADGSTDNTEKINAAIDYLNHIGGGTLLFSPGIYNIRTVHLKSNVYLYVSKGAIIRGIKGGEEPETTWFSDKKYRSGLSPTDTGPYEDPENYLTKQDVGHHYFCNAMFFGERLDNIKIVGNGLITGNGNLVNGDNVMKNPAGNRTDKMFSLKLCTNVEIGGVYRPEDLWYDSSKDEPYYISKDGSKDFATDNMLHIDRTGHFALLATGTDNLNVHDTYFGKNNSSNTRDIYDFMACNNVSATNIYCKVTSDDIIKPGSDCSLGFTRPAAHYKVRNVIGDTNCNLFQIGSETADDIMDLHIDNIYVLGANKAGFSISTNDGAHIKDVHLNCGHTGPIHSRSKMLRTYTPFFISISNRGRILGADVARYKFDENGVKHDELLVTNVNIGIVENIILNGIDVTEVYAGSSYGAKNARWKPYDGSQRRATPIIAGYKLPDASAEGSLDFTLPNGKHTGYVSNIVFNDVHVLVKGGNPASDTSAVPPELGLGQYNASNLKTEPSYGIWARHVQALTVTNSSFFCEQPDNRYVIFLDDVRSATLSGIKMIKTKDTALVKCKNSSEVKVENAGN